jgi:hypothetical protein
VEVIYANVDLRGPAPTTATAGKAVCASSATSNRLSPIGEENPGGNTGVFLMGTLADSSGSRREALRFRPSPLVCCRPENRVQCGQAKLGLATGNKTVATSSSPR